MATFEVKIYKLKIEPHNNADALELAVVGDYRAIVRKGQYNTGDLAAYIPEAAIVPDWLIAKLGLEGRLAGKQKNRVKAVKLRGVLSQGLIVPLRGYWSTFPDACTWSIENETAGMGVAEGDDVTEFLGITKYEPEIPASMSGEVRSAVGRTINFDVENVKKYPNVLGVEEEVVITEKLHGTWACFGYHPDVDTHIITSKGLSAKGLIFKINESNFEKNVYCRTLQATDVDGGGNVIDRAADYFGLEQGFYLLGEIFGQGIQDLGYGASKPQFRLFDIFVGTPGNGRYLNHDEVVEAAAAIGVDMVPILYKGPYGIEVVEKLTSGRETVSGTEANIREGVVIRVAEERRDEEIGRVILKSVSEDYLLRKNATEYN